LGLEEAWGNSLFLTIAFMAFVAFIAFIAFVAFIASVLLKAPPHLKSADLLQEIHFLLEDGVNHLIEFQVFVGRPFDKKGFHFFIQVYRNLKLGDRAIKFPLFRLRKIVFFLYNELIQELKVQFFRLANP
jgi:hypothetical protein